MKDETSWVKSVLLGVSVLLVVGVMIGAIVGYAGLKAADVAGLGDATSTSKPHQDKPFIPRHVGSESSDPSQPSGPSNASPTEPTESTKPPRHNDPKPQRHGIVLTVSPASASTYERVNLSGRYAGHNRATLQVQRLEGGTWADFPTTASVDDGRFRTYVETGQTGVNRFRMHDSASGRSSNVVIVRIG
jgi:hypothetical protein